MNAAPDLNFTPSPRYRELDRREEELKRELESVRLEKQEIWRHQFSGSASAEATQEAQANSRATETQEDRSPRELPTRKPTITRSVLPHPSNA